MNEDILKEEIAMLESNNRAMQEEMARTWEKYDKVINNWNELKEENEKLKRLLENPNDMTHIFDNATSIEPFKKEIESRK